REHADHRSNLAAVGGEPEVFDAVIGDVVGVADRTQVAHFETVPVQPADAARAVAPGDARAVGQFAGGVLVGAGGADLRADPGDPLARGPGVGVLGVVVLDELL